VVVHLAIVVVYQYINHVNDLLDQHRYDEVSELNDLMKTKVELMTNQFLQYEKEEEEMIEYPEEIELDSIMMDNYLTDLY
jgi:hypothetical protein